MKTRASRHPDQLGGGWIIEAQRIADEIDFAPSLGPNQPSFKFPSQTVPTGTQGELGYQSPGAQGR